MLGGLLIGREDAINVWDVITQLSPFQEYYPDIAKLSDAFKAAEALKAGSNRTPGTSWYTKDTCAEFHKLLLSALIAYTNALRIFKKLWKKRVAFGEQLWRAAYLLWRITDSCILRHHLKLVNYMGLLSHPIRPMIEGRVLDLDQKFGCLTREGHVKKWVQEGNKEGKDEEHWQESEEEEEEDESKEDFEGDVEEEDGTEEEEDECEEQEISEEDTTEQPEDLELDDDQTDKFLNKKTVEKTYLRWLQLQSAYWIAQDIVTSPQTLSTVDPQTFKISIVNVKYPSNYDRKLVSWTQLIKDLPLPGSINADEVIAAIKLEIDKHVNDPQSHSIFKIFGSRPSYRPQNFTGNLHAEVLLALLIRHIQTGNLNMEVLIGVWISLCSDNIIN